MKYEQLLRIVYLSHTSDNAGVTPIWDKLTAHIAHSGPEIVESGNQEAIQLMFDICRESARVSQKYVDRLTPLIKHASTCDNKDLQAVRNGIFNFGLAVDILKENEMRDNFPRPDIS